HVFLRCRLDDYTSFYWEPTLAAEKDVGFYKDWLNIPDESIYPIILNKNEFEAIHLNNLGAAWYEKGDYVTAVECYKKAIRLNPDYAEAINNLGVIYSKRGNLDIAMDCYKKATRINPNYAAAFSNIGVVFYKQGYLQKAIELFEKAIEKDSNFDKAHANRDFTIMERDSRK
ncbi:MAG TPA: tetratricopeptide repeat protein, partial [Candidatus Aminicenantes bacterium]|nr:tetratricopeptide repeat protein [Candidatus Aminicenantes bacterium]